MEYFKNFGRRGLTRNKPIWIAENIKLLNHFDVNSYIKIPFGSMIS